MFCKSTYTPTARARIGVVGFAGADVHFHRHLRPLLDIEAPRAWFANANPITFNSIVLLRDMTGEVNFCEYTEPRTRAQVQDQLGLLARLHAKFGDGHPLGRPLHSWAEQFGYLATTPYRISTALRIDDRRAWERELVAYYLDRLHAAGGPRIGFDFAWRHYREQLLGALAWWTGTLGQPRNKQDMQPPEVSLGLIERMAAAVDDLDALDAA